MNAKRDERQADIVDRAVDAVRSAPVPPVPADVVQTIVSAATETTDPIGPEPIRRRIFTMKGITKLVAAAVIIAGAIGVILWMTVGSGGATIAWADVQQQLGAIHNMVCSVTVESDLVPSMTMTLMMDDSGRMRQEMPAPYNTVMIMDLTEGRAMTLDENQKRAVIVDMAGLPHQQGNIDDLDILGEFKRMAKSDADIEELPDRQIEGQLAKGYRQGDERRLITLWVDARSSMPVEIQMELELGKMSMSVTMTDFQFNQDLDPQLLSMKVPEGYESQTRAMDLTKPGIEDVAELLQYRIDRIGGPFPDSLDPMDFATGFDKDDPPPQADSDGPPMSESEAKRHAEAEAMRLGELFGRVILFRQQNETLRYVGKDVMPGDPDTPICWVLPEGSQTYRVLYADFSIRDVAPEDLPDIPEAAPGETDATMPAASP